jgi:hypothetical protein
MSRNNLISAELSPEQKNEVLKCLNEAQNILSFLINISAAEKKRLAKMGTRSVGFVDDCIMTFDEFAPLLPNNLDRAELKRDRLLQEDLMAISVKVSALHESIQDSLAALNSDLMTACNDGYAILQRSSMRDNAVKMALERISKRYSRRARPAASISATA